MKIGFSKNEHVGMLDKIAAHIGARVQNGIVQIPKSKGGGYLKGLIISPDLRMIIRDHYMNEALRIERPASDDEDRSILFSFNNLFGAQDGKNIRTKQASIQVLSQRVSYNLVMPAETYIKNITIGISNKYLEHFLSDVDHPIVKTILQGKQDFIFESFSTARIQKTVAEIVNEKISTSLQRFWYHSKCMELLCLLFDRLIERKSESVTEYHIDDLNAIYKIRNDIQNNPAITPVISKLARNAGMSQPKLRKLFRQTFGYPVYEYFQMTRMQEAAKLLREKKLSVSEVGYRLGFTNLSHFTRVFEEHMAMKPKKYSMGQIC